ncbi:MAG: ribosome small subunit-dependent GTPase A [Myxococcaceae bacterium]
MSDWGWEERFDAQPNEPARVLAEHRGGFEVVTLTGERLVQLAGRFKNEARADDLPSVGDWVAVDGDQIVRVLPRKSVFMRRAPGKEPKAQVVAANVDTVFVVAGLDGDFNVRRLERYLTMVYASRAKPVLLLNKADVGDVAAARAETKRLGDVPVMVLSALNREGLEALTPWLGNGQTVAVLGSSGVGKSTLINGLLGADRQSTQEVRDDSKGRHTTTSRQLLKLPAGALIVDTPGLRELQLWDATEGLAIAFADVTELAAQCKFQDCTHTHEPKCAVKVALESGALDADRYDSWLTLHEELTHLEAERSPAQRREQKARDRAASRAMRQFHRRR